MGVLLHYLFVFLSRALLGFSIELRTVCRRFLYLSSQPRCFWNPAGSRQASPGTSGVWKRLQTDRFLDFANQHRFGRWWLGILAIPPVEVRDFLTDHGFNHFVSISGFGLLNRFYPHIEADDVGFPSVVVTRLSFLVYSFHFLMKSLL